MKERDFQKSLINEIKQRYPGAMVLKNNENYIQGIPDLTVLFPNGRWALLECKKDSGSSHRPNQDYYISKANEHGLGFFIDKSNKEDILDAIDRSFKS